MLQSLERYKVSVCMGLEVASENLKQVVALEGLYNLFAGLNDRYSSVQIELEVLSTLP